MTRTHLLAIWTETAGVAVAVLAVIVGLAHTGVAVGAAAVTGRHIFYNGSYHDGYNPGIDPGPVAGENNDDEDAIDPSKRPLLEGSGPATFANWTGCVSGITGLIYDFANTSSVPGAEAFSFELIGRNGTAAPISAAPATFMALPGAGISGATRVTVTFAPGAVKNTWLRVLIDTQFGLPAADVHYWGNAAGDTGSTIGKVIMVDLTDVDSIEHHPWPDPLLPVVPGPIPVDWHWNLNKDDRMCAADPVVCRQHFTTPLTAVQVIDATAVTSLVGRHVFYNNSYYDGKKVGIDPVPLPTVTDPLYIPHEDDGDAIDPSKTPLMPGNGMANFPNWTGFTGGLNGLIYDFVAPQREPTPADFQFHNIGRDGTVGVGPASQIWPSAFFVQDLGGIKRVIITFGPLGVRNSWLQVTIGTGFGLPAADVHWWGNAVCDCGQGNTPPYIIVNATDEIAARNYPFDITNRPRVSCPYDYNKDGFVTATDQITVRNFRAWSDNCVKMITR